MAAAGAFQVAVYRCGSEAALKRVIVERRNYGWQWDALADEFEVSLATIHAWRKRLGITETKKAK